MYLSTPENAALACELTGLSYDELLHIVGTFNASHHSWAGQLRGELVSNWNGVKIVHHYTKKTLWEAQHA